ncbi:hypothetical protein ACFLV7_04180 [Chloroflexota bacterium]
MLFQSGKIVATAGALSLAEHGLDLLGYIQRHLNGDWGDLCEEEDKAENNFSLEHGFRLLSTYNTPLGKLWLITEADRSVTTILLPEEY